QIVLGARGARGRLGGLGALRRLGRDGERGARDQQQGSESEWNAFHGELLASAHPAPALVAGESLATVVFARRPERVGTPPDPRRRPFSGLTSSYFFAVAVVGAAAIVILGA